MKQLNLYRVWEVMNIISEQENILKSKGVYPYILGVESKYYEITFYDFISTFAFKIEEKNICVFDYDAAAYLDSNMPNYSFFPAKLLDFTDEEIIKWFDDKVECYNEILRKNKQKEKEELMQKIKILAEQLENL